MLVSLNLKNIQGNDQEGVTAFVCSSSDGSLYEIRNGMTRSQRLDFWEFKEDIKKHNKAIAVNADLEFVQFCQVGKPNEGHV